MARKLFCQLSPLCYQISLRKEYLLRDIKHANPKLHFARTLCPDNPLPCLWKGHLSPVMRQLHGVDLQLQRNKAQNLKLAAEKINGVIIYPGEIFSFWELVGPPTTKKRLSGRPYDWPNLPRRIFRKRSGRWSVPAGKYDSLAGSQQPLGGNRAASPFGCSVSG